MLAEGEESVEEDAQGPEALREEMCLAHITGKAERSRFLLGPLTQCRALPHVTLCQKEAATAQSPPKHAPLIAGLKRLVDENVLQLNKLGKPWV